MKMILMAALGAVLVLGGCAGPSAEQEKSAAQAKRLSGPELSQMLSGNSLTGRSKTGKSQWTEYYDPSGQIVGMWKSSSETGKYSGTWKVEGDKWCTDYQEVDDADGCAGVGMNGDQIYWYKDDGTAINANRPATYMAGRVAGL